MLNVITVTFNLTIKHKNKKNESYLLYFIKRFMGRCDHERLNVCVQESVYWLNCNQLCLTLHFYWVVKVTNIRAVPRTDVHPVTCCHEMFCSIN